MLSLPSLVKIYLHATPVNLHYSFDRLAGIVRDEMGRDPLSGHLFVFRNRRGDRLKLLLWDDDGFLILYKRLETGAFKFPTVSPETHGVQVSIAIRASYVGGAAPNRPQSPG